MTDSDDQSMLGKIASYTEILSMDPHSTVFVPLCETYRQMGLLEDALEVATKGVEGLPRFSPGHVILGRIQFEMGDLEGALASLETAHEMDPRNIPAIKGMARVLIARGDKGGARRILETAVELAPEDQAIRKMLAAVPAAGNPKEAGKEGNAGAPIATSTIAEIYLKQGLPERALKVYRDLLRVNPQDLQIRQKLAALEQSLQSPAPAQASPANASVEVPEPETPSAPAPAVAVASLPAAGIAEERCLSSLNSWLEAIRQRRENVQ